MEEKPDKVLIWHTDRGSQYVSEVNESKGNCWDTMSENFFHALKRMITSSTISNKRGSNTGYI